ncbi:MAG: ABC transporter permease, partial [Ignavibacteriae bacterium]|nr:ABC transporter permease [Ignavibacteriota bacterium]
MACALMIMLYVMHEETFDDFHENSDNIYRVAVNASIGDTKIGQTHTPAILTPTLLENYPEVESSIRFANYGKGCIVKYDEQTFNEEGVTLVDAQIFKMFTLPFISGNPETALLEPNSVVIDESTAKKYFGNENPLNKILRVDEYDCKITGVMRDIPVNSHFHFKILVSLYTTERYKSDAWFANNFKTYILLKEGVSQASFNAKLPEFVKTYLFEGRSYDEWESKGNFWEYYLQPVKDIHLNSDLNGEFEANGNASYVSMFTIIGIFIILIASINYMNLSTARLSGRAKEVGIRKVVGSSKSLLVRQFLIESVLLSFLSLILSLFILHLALPMFSNLVGVAELSIPYFDNLLFIPFLIGFALLIGVLSGSYPAIYLSSVKSINALSGKGIK